MDSLDKEAESYYPDRLLIEYYKNLVSHLERRIEEYKDKIDKLEKD